MVRKKTKKRNNAYEKILHYNFMKQICHQMNAWAGFEAPEERKGVYPPPEIQLLEVETEAGFANSLSIESPEDDDLPQLKDLDGWNEWID